MNESYQERVRALEAKLEEMTRRADVAEREIDHCVAILEQQVCYKDMEPHEVINVLVERIDLLRARVAELEAKLPSTGPVPGRFCGQE